MFAKNFTFTFFLRVKRKKFYILLLRAQPCLACKSKIYVNQKNFALFIIQRLEKLKQPLNFLYKIAGTSFGTG